MPYFTNILLLLWAYLATKIMSANAVKGCGLPLNSNVTFRSSIFLFLKLSKYVSIVGFKEFCYEFFSNN